MTTKIARLEKGSLVRFLGIGAAVEDIDEKTLSELLKKTARDVLTDFAKIDFNKSVTKNELLVQIIHSWVIDYRYKNTVLFLSVGKNIATEKTVMVFYMTNDPSQLPETIVNRFDIINDRT